MKKRNRTEAHIKGLHTQIRGLKNDNRHLRRRIEEIKEDLCGTCIVTWKPHEATQLCGGLELGNLNPNNRIAIIGKVKHVQAWAEKECDNLHSQITYEVLETRRIGI